MAMEDHPEQEQENPNMGSEMVGEIIPADREEPVSPKAMSDEEAKRLQDKAIELVDQLRDATGSAEMDLLDGVTSVGVQAQRNAASQLGLLKTRVGTFLSAGGASKDIAEGLRDLRLTLNQINPQEMTRPGIVDRVSGVLPFVKGRYNPVSRAMSKVALRYEPVSRQVAVIENKLRDGRALLVRDNVELRKLYEDVEAQQPTIQRNAYLGELLMRRLSRLLEETDDPEKRDRVQSALHDVAMRVQGLRTMEELHDQYFVGIGMTRQNNTRLGQSVERTLTLATNVVVVGLAIQSALIQQKKVARANEETRKFLGDLVAVNAASILRHTEEIGDLYNSPVTAIEKVTQAHNDLVEALTTASRLRQEGIEAARDNIAQLAQLSSGLEGRVGGLLPDGASEPKSIEA